MKGPLLFTIGHSTRSIAEFTELLHAYGVTELVDVRTIAKSRHNPQFNEPELKESLKQVNVHYTRIQALGGLRHSNKESVNMGWRNASFRSYADYMATQGFSDGLEELMKIAIVQPTAIMCAEAVPWRCHRSLIGDALVVKGWTVRDIMSATSAPEHRLTPFLKVAGGELTYPAPKE
jgi:uncharacterized protein (DUF488 family)